MLGSDPSPGDRSARPVGDSHSAPACHRLILISGDDHFIFLFTRERREEVLRVADRFAENPELAFSTAERDFVAAVMRRTFDGE